MAPRPPTGLARGTLQRMAVTRPAVIQKVNDDSGHLVAIHWAGLTALEASGYLKKLDQGWTATPGERSVLRWVAGGSVGAAPAARAALVAAAAGPHPAGSTPGGSFVAHAPAAGGTSDHKVGFTFRAGAPAPARALVEAAFREMRNKRSMTKRMFEAHRVQAPGGLTPDRGELFGSVEGTAHVPVNLQPAPGKRLAAAPAGMMGPALLPAPAAAGSGYAQILDALQDEPALLDRTAPFAGGQLALGAPAGGLQTIITPADGAVVAYLTVGAAQTYRPAPAHVGAALARPLLVKRGSDPAKHYVKDNRGVVTRRYAYCEKNFWQFMDFLTNGRMEGRFQTFSRAIGHAAPDLFATASTSVTAAGPLTMEQMAVLHQWKGTGPEQRGLSLTSTRGGVVVANAGESFHSSQGFLLTIDLSRVPRDVILLNQFAAGGVRAEMGQVNPRVYGGATPAGPGARYNFTGSVAKNRELFLERLEPAWISEVEWHGAPLAPRKLGEPSAHAAGPAGWMAHVRQTTGHDYFVLGFNAMIAAPPAVPAAVMPPNAGKNWMRNRVQALGVAVHGAPAPALPVPPVGAPPLSPLQIQRYGEGVSAARHYLLGHLHGVLRQQRAAVGVAPAAPAPVLDFDTVREGHGDVGDYRLAQGGLEHAPEMYMVGFAHGRSAQAPAGLDAAFLQRGRGVAVATTPAGPRGAPGAGGVPQHELDVADVAAQTATQQVINAQQAAALLPPAAVPAPVAVAPPLRRSNSARF